MRAIHLKTEHLVNPTGIDIRNPYLSWNCADGVKQSAYEICVESSDIRGERSEIWNSGKIETDVMQAYIDTELRSRQHIWWRIRLWDEHDLAGEWSEEAEFEMGLLEADDFHAKWINPELECDTKVHKPASILRKKFHIQEKKGNPSGIIQARLYITCHGLYEAWLNGKRVGNFVLTPGSYTYDKRLAYQTYDVTAILNEGENEIQVILGDGWYRSCSGVDGDRNLYGEDVALYCQLEVDGKPVCVSDETWQAAQDGPIRENDMQQGEVYDARLEKNFPGIYGESSGNDTVWHGVKTEDFGTENLVCSNCVPVVEKERFEGKLFETPNGETVIDYDQNLAGYVEFTVHAHAGERIVLTHGETLDENGNFTTENFQDRERHKEGGTKQQVTYICKEGINHYKARFTIWGFRYAKIETNVDLSSAQFTAIAVYSDMEQTGFFHCSDNRVNQLVKNSLWSMKSNFCDVPTDCPTRERAAWTGDMGVFIDTGLYLMDCYPVVRKWLGECRLNQYEDGKVANIAPKNNNPSYFTHLLAGSVGWGDASIIVPYALYKRFGDQSVLEENYEMMQKWYAFLTSRAKQKPEAEEIDLSQLPEQYREMAAKMPKEMLEKMKQKMMGTDSAENPYEDYTIDTGVDYGEWCEPDVESTSVMGKPQNKVATAYYAYSGRLLAKISEILGKKEEAGHYREIADKAAQAFHFIAARNGEIQSDRQAEYVRAIAFDLLSEEEKRAAAATLNQMAAENEYHLNTGFLSTPALCKVLTEYGYTETAYRLLLQDSMPGWLYAVKKGATTIWENWDGINEKGEVKASLNHYSYGAVCGWLFADVCGIRLEHGRVKIAPHPHPLLEHAEGTYQSPVGEIVSGWKYVDGTIRYKVAIPANVQAELVLPDGRREKLGAGEWEFCSCEDYNDRK